MIADIARQIEETLCEGSPQIFIEGRVFEELRNGIMHAGAEIIVRHRSAGDADYGKTRRETAFVSQAVKRGHQLAFCEIAIGAENHDDARRRLSVEAQRIIQRRFD